MKNVRAHHLLVSLVLAWILGLPAVTGAAPGSSAGPRFDLPDDAETGGIVILYRGGTAMRIRGGRLVRDESRALPGHIQRSDLVTGIAEIESLAKTRGFPLRRLFSSLTEERLTSLRVTGESRSGRSLTDLNRYHAISVPRGTKFRNVKNVVARLNAIAIVELAYAQPIPQVASHNPPTPNYESTQGYLGSDTNGIDVASAWDRDGGRGEGIRVSDVEYGWNIEHEDLPTSELFDYGPDVLADHGTKVLGVIGAIDNGFGVTGIANAATLRNWEIENLFAAEAIGDAASESDPGDVVLIEVEYVYAGFPDTCDSIGAEWGCEIHLPVEYAIADFSVIDTATANGVIFVEAAGNTGVNLDHEDLTGLSDSGAIMVGASESAARKPWNELTPEHASNYGSRIDVHGWGENVVTTGGGDLFGLDSEHNDKKRFYTSNFGGTSSATAIVAGAVASIQGVVKAAGFLPLTPLEMRTLLTATGTPQEEPIDRNIGPLPNLGNAINNIPRDLVDDSIPAMQDNCIGVTNPDQLDGDMDGYGDVCDGDFNNDGSVTGTDIFTMWSPVDGNVSGCFANLGWPIFWVGISESHQLWDDHNCAEYNVVKGDCSWAAGPSCGEETITLAGDRAQVVAWKNAAAVPGPSGLSCVTTPLPTNDSCQ